jgi:hypothetical protein
LQGEYIRYGVATALGSGRIRLSRLQRGHFSSSVAAATHVNDDILLLNPDSAKLLDELGLALGSTVAVEALGLGDLNPVVATTTIVATATTPPVPVHGRGYWHPDGSLALSWVRRSRVDMGWRDGVDQLMPEGIERYEVSLVDGELLLGQWVVSEPRLLLSVAELTALNPPSQANFAVRQIGRYRPSNALLIAPPFG